MKPRSCYLLETLCLIARMYRGCLRMVKTYFATTCNVCVRKVRAVEAFDEFTVLVLHQGRRSFLFQWWNCTIV
jgi:hypothetical protein